MFIYILINASLCVSIVLLIVLMNWEPLHDRRDKHQLLLFLYNAKLPQHLTELVPQHVGSIARYDLQNPNKSFPQLFQN